MKKLSLFFALTLILSACVSGPERAQEMELRQALKTSLTHEAQVKQESDEIAKKALQPPVIQKDVEQDEISQEGDEESTKPSIQSDGKLSVVNASEEDEAQFQKEREAENAVIDASFDLANFYYEKEEWAKAVKMYESILDRKWDNFMALNNLFAIYEDHLEKNKLAAKVMDTMHTLYGANIEVTRDAVRIYLKTGQIDKAEKALKFFESRLSVEDRLGNEDFLKTEKNKIFRAKAAQ